MECNNKSAATIIAELWEDYGKYAKTVGCSIAGLATANPGVTIECLAGAKKVEEAAKKAITFWNKMTGNSWATIGPRELNLGQKEEGTLKLSGDRLFITPSPFTCDKVKIQISEQDGKGEVEVTGCLFVGKSGNRVFNFEWNEDSDERKDEDQSYSKTISGVKGKYLSVLLNGKVITKSFKYTIKVSKA